MDRRNILRSVALGGLAAGLIPQAAAAAAPRVLTMVTSWPAGFPGLGTSANRIARRIETATGGSFRVRVHAANEKVGPFEVFDAVSVGEADLYHSADYYQAATSPGSNFFTAVPFGMTATEMAGWLLHGGGQALWDSLAAANNIKPLMCTSTGAQMGGWFNREIRSVDDFDALRVRMPGLGGEALRKLGAIPVNLAGGAIYAALKDGSLDAAEWVGPWNDLAANLHEVAEHYYYPGFHEPGGTLALGVNLDVWLSFSDQEREIFIELTTAEYLRSLTEFNWRNAAALQTLKSEHGVEPKAFSADILTRIAEISESVVADSVQNDAAASRIHASFSAARQQSLSWSGIGEEAFSRARRNYVES